MRSSLLLLLFVCLPITAIASKQPGSGPVYQSRTSIQTSQIPRPPSNVRVVDVSDSTARIRWSATSSNVHGYNIYRNGTYVTTVHNTEYTARGLARNTNYRFSVVTISSSRQFSVQSNAVDVRTSSNVNRSNPSNAGGSGRIGFVPDGYRLVFSDEFRQRQINQHTLSMGPVTSDQ